MLTKQEVVELLASKKMIWRFEHFRSLSLVEQAKYEQMGIIEILVKGIHEYEDVVKHILKKLDNSNETTSS